MPLLTELFAFMYRNYKDLAPTEPAIDSAKSGAQSRLKFFNDLLVCCPINNFINGLTAVSRLG
jgi:hypothetical protein